MGAVLPLADEGRVYIVGRDVAADVIEFVEKKCQSH